MTTAERFKKTLTQGQGAALLTSATQHLISTVPRFRAIEGGAQFEKGFKVTAAGIILTFTYLQDYENADEELDEIVLAQLLIFLAKSKKIDDVSELIVNLSREKLKG